MNNKVSFVDFSRGDNITEQSKKNGSGEPPMTTLEQRVSHLEKDTSEIKAEVKQTRKDLIDFQIKTIEEFGKVRTDVEKVRTELQTSMRQQTIWLFGLNVTLVGVAIAVMRFFP
ncbi:hypothetical protein VF_2038 [Aliivibrio fischeri ES114]|uniref:DUF1640 domain-containing protein n=1 Tax=Aliivibrio fischeri (strain ATCC 700601 / ES114) TaxID=312309 RepID=Q5E363_ALIF1|nr:hypothetical protein [Aliivibrio fischeri]AAW86533.1 hypothetical protein VF_2038 [Aliivibrio fischeri ES114]KLU79178.1 hypothetical protein AB192_06465 [Aliivibrio fischeri]